MIKTTTQRLASLEKRLKRALLTKEFVAYPDVMSALKQVQHAKRYQAQIENQIRKHQSTRFLRESFNWAIESATESVRACAIHQEFEARWQRPKA